MFAHIEGLVMEKQAGELVIDAGGVGFLLLCSAQTLAAAPKNGERMRCYTHFSVREDGMDLFGFSTREERDMFRRLNGVSGVGPRTALGILSALPLKDLSLALLTGDAAAISRAQGVGKKTAQRLILELRDKIAPVEAGMEASVQLPSSGMDAVQEAIMALMALGYSNGEATAAVAAVSGKADTTDALILLALKGLGG